MGGPEENPRIQFMDQISSDGIITVAWIEDRCP